MRSGRRERSHRHSPKEAALVALALLALVALTTLVAACGGGVEGEYKLIEGDDAMKDFTFTLEGDEFTLAGPNPMGGDDLSLKGTYNVDGDKISLNMQGEQSEVGTIDGDKLVFQDVTWEKK
jgi:hypothetical protein